MEHELKHFHDLMVTPFGEYCISDNLKLLSILPEILQLYKTQEDINIRIPLSDFLKDKDFNVNGLNNFNSQVERLFLYENSFGMNSIDIIEGLATCIEIQVINRVIGRECAIFYLNYMLDNDKKLGPYIKALNIIFAELEINDLNIVHKILFYSLCGDYYNEGEFAFPANRFHNLIFYMKDDTNKDYNETIENFYLDNNVIHPKVAIKNSQNHVKTSMKKFETIVNNDMNPFKKTILKYCKNYFKERNNLINQPDFFENYINLETYLDNDLIMPDTFYYAVKLENGKGRTIQFDSKDNVDIILSKGVYPTLFKLNNINTNKLETDKDFIIQAMIFNLCNMKSIEDIQQNEFYLSILNTLENTFNIKVSNYTPKKQ